MLDGYVCAITGASSGIGAAAARRLVSRGARVALGGRREERVRALADELGSNAIAVPMDVRIAADSALLVDRTVAAFGRIDGLIVSAGIGSYGGILDGTDDELENMITTNVTGSIWPIRAAIPAMLDQGSGDIVIISSVAGLQSRANEAVYAATKHAQIGLANGIDRELHRRGIRTTVMCPGGVVTEFAMGTGRTAQSPDLADMLAADDVAVAIADVLEQPKSMRTLTYVLRGATEEN